MIAPSSVRTEVGALEAFDQLLDTIGIVPSSISPEFAPWIPRSEWQQVSVKRWILIDDMEDLGWTSFLKLALNLREDELVSVGQAAIQLFFDQGMSGLEQGVLFLDLRLFARASWEDERRFLESLLQNTESRKAGSSGPAWSGFTDDEVAAVRRCIQKSKRSEDADYHVALTFFPRVISRAFPTLPIILFSSTGRKEIAERLRPYGNIILDFAKPLLSGSLAPDFVCETRHRFELAVRRALNMARARGAYQRVAGEARSATGDSWADGGVFSPLPPGQIVEVYIDESGGGPFAVGGIVVSFPDEGTIADFDKALADEGLVWGLAEGHAPTSPDDPLPTRYLPKEHIRPHGYETDLRRIIRVAEEVSPTIQFAGVALVQERPPAHADTGASVLFREDSLDNLYRFMLEELCAHLLLDWLPYYSPEASTVRIDVATRMNSVSNRAELSGLRHDFGINVHPSADDLYFSLETSDVYKLVARVIGRDSCGALSIPVERARGVTLFDYKSGIEQFRQRWRDDPAPYRRRVTNTFRPRQIHFLADWFSRFAANQKLRGEVPTSKDLFRRGFLQARHSAYRHLTAAAEHSRRHRAVDCVLEADQALRSAATSASGKYALGRWQLKSIAQSLQGFSGHDFLELTERFAALREERPGT
jgi:hypothetical protein